MHYYYMRPNMTDVFFTELNDLLDRCNLADDEKEFLEQLAEFMVFPDRDMNKDPRSNEPETLFSRSIHKLRREKQLVPYKKLIYEYQKKVEKNGYNCVK